MGIREIRSIRVRLNLKSGMKNRIFQTMTANHQFKEDPQKTT